MTCRGSDEQESLKDQKIMEEWMLGRSRTSGGSDELETSGRSDDHGRAEARMCRRSDGHGRDEKSTAEERDKEVTDVKVACSSSSQGLLEKKLE